MHLSKEILTFSHIMLAVNRHQLILDLIEKNGSVRTIDLAQQLNVTDETIRRDLEKLEKDNLVQRTHGGAIKTQYFVKDRSFEERNIQHINEKQRIATEALKLIEPKDRIFFDASSTVLQLVRQIPNMPLVVMTNSVLVASELEKHEDIEVIFSGGTLDRQSKSYVGPAAIATLRRFRIDKVFFSGNGIDGLRGISEINEAQAYIKEMVIPRSGSVIYLADPSKLGINSTYFFARCEELDTLVTCKEANHPLLNKLEEEGVEIRFAE
jgi:DeoR family transcriptional regulator, L-fucose operon activator